jgi:hypothetical protein
MTDPKKKNKIVVTFDKSLKTKVIEALGYSEDKDDCLVDIKNPTQRAISPDGLEVVADKFAGAKKGSLLLYNSDLPSLIKFSDKLCVEK